MRYWLNTESALAPAAVIQVILIGAALAGFFALRAAWRMQAHFHELHYQPLIAPKGAKRPIVGEQPLTWWAVKRVAHFSGRVNLWLAGGFGLMYAAYLVAGDAWPTWLGRVVFVMCDQAGGVPALTTGLARRLRVAVPTMTRMLDGLAERGLIERQPDPTSRRPIVDTTTARMRVTAKFICLITGERSASGSGSSSGWRY